MTKWQLFEEHVRIVIEAITAMPIWRRPADWYCDWSHYSHAYLAQACWLILLLTLLQPCLSDVGLLTDIVIEAITAMPLWRRPADWYCHWSHYSHASLTQACWLILLLTPLQPCLSDVGLLTDIVIEAITAMPLSRRPADWYSMGRNDCHVTKRRHR